jgi:hypothetical protein
VRAISLWQPWALMVSLGVKSVETRSRRTHYRGPLAICSTATTPRKVFDQAIKIPAVVEVMKGVPPLQTLCWILRPQGGMVVATCDLVDCVRVEDASVSPEERSLGDYSPGRWAWILRNVKRLDPAPAVKGRQGLWTPSPELRATIEAAALASVTT